MSRVLSKDGTSIAYARSGQGAPLILVDGALCYRAFGPSGPLAALLEPHFTVFRYDRRGRGESGDTTPWTVEREVEDLDALIREAGGSTLVYGVSSGAALALEAANRGLAIRKLALYEAPFVVDGTRPPVTAEHLEEIRQAVASGRRGDAVALFMKIVGTPTPFVWLMRLLPMWSKLKLVAPTLVYDLSLVAEHQRGKPFPPGRWSSVKANTLALVGGKSPAWMRNAMQAVAGAVPGAGLRTLDGQNHMVSPKALAPVIADFFNG